MADLGGAFSALQALADAAGALMIGLAGAAIFLAAYLAVKTHGAGYAPFSLKRVLTWYSRVIMLVAILIIAMAAAHLLAVLAGTLFGDNFAFGEHDSPDYGLAVAEEAFVVLAAALVYVTHQRLRSIFDPAPGDPTARRFLVAATTVIFGVASFVLLIQGGIATIRYIDNGGGGPGALLAGLIVALAFWGVALVFLRRELNPPD